MSRRVSRQPYRAGRDRREVVVAVAVAVLIVLVTVTAVWILAPADEDDDAPTFTPTLTAPTGDTGATAPTTLAPAAGEAPATTAPPGG